jgi:uncharacterized membrane protein
MPTRDTINLTQIDRWGYVGAGLALLAWGLQRRTLARGGALGIGGWLLYQAYTGNNPMFKPLGIRVNRNPAESEASETILVDETITIGKPRADIYRFWRDLNNLNRFAPDLQSVEVLDERRSRWKVKGPHGGILEWDSEITRDDPEREIAWRTTHNREVTNFGSVSFVDAPGGRGTIVKVHLEYVPPAGSIGTAVARMMGQSPQRMVEEALHRLKQLLEAGEISTTAGQPAGAHRAQSGARDAGGGLASAQ